MRNYTIIVAVSNDYVIGIDGELPWHLPGDMKFFKETTTGEVVLMGRKTFESIGQPLPSRTNLVLTTDESWDENGTFTINDIDDIAPFENIFVIGGSEIYSKFLPLANRVYMTHVDVDVDDIFATRLYDFFPNEWELVRTIKDTEERGIKYKILEYKRK